MALADVLGYDTVDFLKNIDPISPAYSAFRDGFANLEDATQLQVPPYENVSKFASSSLGGCKIHRDARLGRLWRGDEHG